MPVVDNEADEIWLQDDRHHIVRSGTNDFPELLAEIQDPPDKLYVIGNVDALHLPALAIVGSRNPTRGGLQNAFEFARHLGASGFCIVSGLAQGVDAAAHEGALAGNAHTVAFLGHGIDTIYPATHGPLAERMTVDGALCSEFPLGSPPRREHFPQRNRLISGLSTGTLVVEAARRSGSLITARLAAEQGREIFAIPGSIHNPLARGCHQLIRQGAKLVESAADIVGELGPMVGHLMQKTKTDHSAAPVPTRHDDEYKSLLSALSYDPATADEIALHCGLTIDQVSSMLLILELEGTVDAHAGGRYGLRHGTPENDR